MRKLTILLAAITLATAHMQAVVVDNVAGGLSARLTDTNVTNLTITGTLDARDFKYIADKLNLLTEVNLADARIIAYENETPVFGQQTAYLPGELPQTAFFGKPLTKVVLPSELKIIGHAAFAGCEGITAISFPASTDSISGYAFSATGFSTLRLPATVIKIGEGAFSRCKNLASVTVEAGHIGAKAFFANALLSDVRIGTGVTAIGSTAFAGCTSLSTVQWSSATQLKHIGAEAFIATQMNDASLTKFPSLNTVGDWAYAGTPITEVALPASVSEVGDGAFYYAKNITHLVLPTKVKNVGAYLAAGTQVANNDIWHAGIERIGDYAFHNLSAIENITIPAHVTYIGTMAMAGWTGLKHIDAEPTEVPRLGFDVWAGVPQAEVMLVTNTADYLNAAQWKDFMVRRRVLLGDANDDGMVNVSDITTIINHILGNEPEPFSKTGADCNCDGVINVSDVTATVNVILGHGSKEIYAEWEVNTDDNVEVDELFLTPGETRTVDVKLNNSRAYTAMQFDLLLPEGVEIVSIGTGKRSASHAIVSGTMDDGSVRILGYNMQNHDFSEGDGGIVSLTLKAGAALESNATIEVKHTILATADGETYFAPPTETRIGGISGVSDVNARGAKVYAQHGMIVIESEEATTAQLVTIGGTSIGLAVEAGHNEYEAPAAGIYIVRIGGKSHKLIIN
ncbi:MAG: leucine-rich repeat protein [Bacteroidales bacterium]|nr:leucine-rich repeat protein [Bacteroidales bacterium]